MIMLLLLLLLAIKILIPNSGWNSLRRRYRKNVVYSHWSQHCCRHHRAVANIPKCSLRLAYREYTFWASLLETDSKFVHSSVANTANKRPLTELSAPSAIMTLIANGCVRWRGISKGLSQDGGRTDFSGNLRDSLCNDDLSNEPTFSQVHLAGQYL
jgi:hypothetical protein